MKKETGTTSRSHMSAKSSLLKKYLSLQMQRAKDLGMNWVVDIELSPLSKKKYRVILSDGCHVDSIPKGARTLCVSIWKHKL
jgi:hypothetical protein